MTGARGTPRERFERYYVPEPNFGCWLWIGSLTKGYGAMSMPGGVPAKAHVLSYELFCGTVPDGMVVRHICDVRCCVNPDHLLLGTQQDNVADAVRRLRHPRGERHGAARLTTIEAIAIRADHRSAAIVAAEAGITVRQVYYIKAGRRWGTLR